jgi:Fe-S cluster biogenesis protein NfuA
MNSVQLSDDINQRVEVALQSIRPYLIADGGNVELVEITSDLIVKLKLTGACSSCDMSHMTMKAGLEEGIKKAVPEIQSVVSI